MQAKQKPIDTVTCSDLGVGPEVRQRITSVEPVPARQAGEVVEDDGEGHVRIVAFLEAAKVV
jgi:electron transfer flavoprotein beta subunit